MITAAEQSVQRSAVEIADAVLSDLAPALDAFHGEQHDRQYWATIVGPWLSRFVFDAHTAWSDPEPASATPLPVPADQSAYVHLTEVGAGMAGLGAALRGGSIAGSHSSRSPPPTLAHRAGHVLGAAMPGRPRIASRGPYLSGGAQARLMIASRGRVAPWSVQAPPASPPRQRDWSLPDQGSPFERAVRTILPAVLPVAHVEGYRAIARTVDRSRAVDAVYSAVGWSTDETLKVFAAKQRERGARLIGHQHGGLYGAGRAPLAEQEAANLDRFLTWGWTGDGCERPAFGAKLSETVERVRAIRSTLRPIGILSATTSVSRHSAAGLGFPSGREFPQVIEWQERFLRGLTPPARDATRVRAYPTAADHGWDQRTRFAALARLDNEPSFARSLASAGLFVGDNNFTTALEALACDIPTIIFFDPRLWPIHPRAEPAFQRLAEAGAFHTDPEAAAAHVGSIHKDPLAWWHRADVRQAVESFVTQFAAHRADYLPALARILTEEARA